MTEQKTTLSASLAPLGSHCGSTKKDDVKII
jgi:hypothetical protein